MISRNTLNKKNTKGRKVCYTNNFEGQSRQKIRQKKSEKENQTRGIL